MAVAPISLEEIARDGLLRVGADGSAKVRLPVPATSGHLWTVESSGPVITETAWDATWRGINDDGNPQIGGNPDVILTVRRTGGGWARVSVAYKQPWKTESLRAQTFDVSGLAGNPSMPPRAMGRVFSWARRLLTALAPGREPPKCGECGSTDLKTYSMGADVVRCESCGHVPAF